jgi:hypothetical protein
VLTQRQLGWPGVAFGLGFTPLPMMAVAAEAVRLLRCFVSL